MFCGEHFGGGIKGDLKRDLQIAQRGLRGI